MKPHLLFFALISLGITFSGCTGSEDSDHVLWYESPASTWVEMLPLGNGRMGMMPDGSIENERIILNEISLWSGCERDYANPDAAASLPLIRDLLLKGKNAEAQEVMYERFMPKKDVDETSYGTYQVLGALDIRTPSTGKPESYCRRLDLRNATAYTEYVSEGIRFIRRYHANRQDDVLTVEISSDQKGSVELEASLVRPVGATIETVADGLLKMSGELESGVEGVRGMKYAAYARLLAEGPEARISGGKVTGADRAWIVVSCGTSFFEGEEYDAKALKAVEDARPREMDRMYRRGVKAFRELYDRVELHLASSCGMENLPTDKRLEEYAKGAKDNSLATLYYNFGRYLLISSTRPGSLPPNLQGLWANTFHTPWNGDYHTNINVQMNHWIAEPGNLSELHLPLTDLVMNMVPSGEKSARDFYGPSARGWVQHMMTNVWNYTAPGEHPSWGATNTGGAWLCAHLWEHYLYISDKDGHKRDYLERVYPAIEGSARFFLSTMIHEPSHGWLVTAPSSSPENAFYVGETAGERKAVSICMGPTMDNQLVRELFTNTIEAYSILYPSEKNPFIDSLKTALTQLPPHMIGSDGRLQEWLMEYEETDPQHRHISHLYGLHPGSQISPTKTPELAEACRKTLELRGDEATGWSRAWKINFWARLGDGDRALKLFRSLLHPAYDPANPRHHISGTYPNLFCSHPPFQIDGNFGGAAGISEMLLQSHEGFINPLPALPSEWSEGSLRGFKVRGGSTVSLKWKDGKITSMKVRN